jgi:hypothetical protein
MPDATRSHVRPILPRRILRTVIFTWPPMLTARQRWYIGRSIARFERNYLSDIVMVTLQ